MKMFKKLIVASATLMIGVGILTGCSSLTGDKQKKQTSKENDSTLLMYRVGEKPKNFDDLMEYVNGRLKKETGVELNIQYIGWGDYAQKMSVITSSGEDYDIAFADSYVNNAQKGAYKDLTDLAPKYAKETMDNLDPTYIEGNKVNGKLYAIPVNGNVYAQKVITFDKKLVDKYNLDITGVKDLEDLEPLLQVIKDKEPSIPPFPIGKDVRLGNMDYVYDPSVPLGIDMDSQNMDKIINPYTESDRLLKDLKDVHSLYSKKLIPSDAATSESIYRLDEETWFARIETQGPFDYGDTILSRAAGRELISVPFTEPIKDNGQMFVANWVVSNTSKNVEKSLEVLNMINTDKELLTTMVFGLEGEGWEKVGDEQMKVLPGYDASSKIIGGAWMTGDNNTLFSDERITDEMIEKRDESIAEAQVSPLLGFSFDESSVKTEVTNIKNVTSQYYAGFSTGTLDPAEKLEEFNNKLEAAGLSKVQKEMQKQFDEFRSNK